MLIAKSIILSDEYEGGQPDCYVFALSDSSRYRYYYKLIEPLCAKAEFVTSLPSFPLYLVWLKRRFYGLSYRNIYIASIDSVQIQFALSWVNFDEVRTFDDGTANINESSIYYHDKSDLVSRAKDFIRWVFGNRYSRKKIVRKSSIHYTLYPSWKNLVETVKPVRLGFANTGSELGKRKERIVVFIGTVFKDVVNSSRDQSLLVERIRRHYLDKNNYDTVYLPHPRDEFDYFPEIPKRESNFIAEEVILNLFNEYTEIELVGFGSSTQFNLMAQPAVKNIVLDSYLLKKPMRELIKMLVASGAKRVMLD